MVHFVLDDLGGESAELLLFLYEVDVFVLDFDVVISGRLPDTNQ